MVVFFLLSSLFVMMLSLDDGGGSFRRHERSEAIKAYMSDKSPANKAVFVDEMRRLDHHRSVISYSVNGSLLIIDALVVYVFWNYGARKTAA